MGKRGSEQPPGDDGKSHIHKSKRSFQEDSEAGDNGLDVTGPAQTGDSDRKPTSWGEMTCGSTGNTATNAPRSANGDGEAAAPEQSWDGERVSSPLTQDGRGTGIGGGGKSPEAAAPAAASQPESPQRANSVADETEEDQPVVTTEQHRSISEEPDAKIPTHCGTGNTSDGPEHGSAAAVRGEGAAGREVALPADAPGRSTGRCPLAASRHHKEGVNRSEPGERRGDTSQSRELPHVPAVNAKEKELERAAGGEHREDVSRDQPWATSMNDAVKHVAESWCSPASGIVSAEVSGVCTMSAVPKGEGGTAEPESAGTAGTVGLVSWPLGGSSSPQKTSGEANACWEEARGGETPSPATGSAPDSAVPAGGNPAGENEGERLAEEPGAEARHGAEHAVSARRDAQPPARSGDLPHGRGIAESTPAVPATPGPAPAGTVQPPAGGTGSGVDADPQDETCAAREQFCLQSELEGNSLELPSHQPLPDADPAVHGCKPHAMAGWSCTEEGLPLTEGNGLDQQRPRDAEPEGLRPPTRSEDATDVVCGLILELSHLNRLAMSAHRGLEALRRPKPRQSRRPGLLPVPLRAGKRWKEM